jgi:hypothetical protein
MNKEYWSRDFAMKSEKASGALVDKRVSAELAAT